MGRLEEAKGVDAIDLIADLIDPITDIAQDDEIQKITHAPNTPVLKIVKAILKLHKKEAVEILAILDGVPAEEYRGTVLTITKKLLSLISNPELQDFFGLSGQKTEQKSSGSATENTVEKEI